MKILVLKPLGFRKLSHSSEMRNDAQRYGPTKRCAVPRRKIQQTFFGMLIMYGGFFLRHVALLAIVIGQKTTPKKSGAAKDKLFLASISRRWRRLQCSSCNDKQYSLSFLRCGAAQRGAARRLVGP